jgi:serine/threonine protein kinase
MDLLEQLAAALGERYRIERERGHGGMAIVFLAEDLKHRRSVAIKLLKPELSAILGSERFLREIEIAATLQHPHILPLYDSGEAAGLVYYVMPFAEGESLRQRLAREQQLPLDAALQVTREVGSARPRPEATCHPTTYFALVHAGLGERDQALRYLERAYEERLTVLAYLLIDPRLAPLRDDPRFVALAGRLGGE